VHAYGSEVRWTVAGADKARFFRVFGKMLAKLERMVDVSSAVEALSL
jgi:hypothetical protein